MAHSAPMKNVRIPEALRDRAAEHKGISLTALGIERERKGWYTEDDRLNSTTRVVERALVLGLDEMDRRLKEKTRPREYVGVPPV